MQSLISKDRRTSQRVVCNVKILLQGADKNGPRVIPGLLLDLSPRGGRVAVEHAVGNDFRLHSFAMDFNGQKFECIVKSFIRIENGQISFQSNDEQLQSLFVQVSSNGAAVIMLDRRKEERRTAKDGHVAERRQKSRRLLDLWSNEFKSLDQELPSKARVLFRQKSLAYDGESVQLRRDWLETKLNKSFKALSIFSESTENYTGNIENLIGVAHIPIGVAGPLRINGEHAEGDFYVPLATTEGVLVNSYTLGMTLITRSGGATVRLLTDELRISPSFAFENTRQASVFVRWVQANFQKIKQVADGTSKYGKLLRVEPKLLGRQVAVLFVYDTGDAMGLNMICRATEVACQYILQTIKPQTFYLRSNFSSNKKVSNFNMQNSYGKSLVAEVVIPRKLLSLLETTPEEMTNYSQSRLVTGIHAGMVGNNGHYANGLAAIFAACGQDIAHVASSHVGVSLCETTLKGDLYVSAYIPNLLVGTVGGGTRLATSRACLEMLDCYGQGKAKKFAEIVAATLLAGEISICAALVNGRYVEAHERYGRNRPT